MNVLVMQSLTRVGFIFNLDPRGFTFITHNTGRDVTEFDRERISDVFPGTVVAIMDDEKRIVVLH